MITVIAVLLFLIFLTLSSIHIYWGFGGRWGRDVVIPTRDDNVRVMMPGPLPTFMVAFGLLTFGFFILVASGLITFILPRWLDAYGLWIIASIFILRATGEFNYVGFFKKHTKTKFGQNDTKYYSPLCLLVGLLTLVIEWSK